MTPIIFVIVFEGSVAHIFTRATEIRGSCFFLSDRQTKRDFITVVIFFISFFIVKP